MRDSCTMIFFSTNSKQEINRKLVQTLVSEPFLEKGLLVERGLGGQQLLLRKSADYSGPAVARSLLENALDLFVSVPALSFFFQN